MKAYLDLLHKLMLEGNSRTDRTGVGTWSLFGYQMRFDLRDRFPLLTTKKLHVKSIIHELLWFISGSTSARVLQESGVRIWDEWATPAQTARFARPEGELGPVYGHQWRNYGATLRRNNTYMRNGVDQLRDVVRAIRETPDSRRLIVTGWNPKEVNRVTLPPCHTMFQFYVNGSELSCQLYQRSADAFLGLPFNIASYALLTSMVAHVSGLTPGDFVHTLGDVHLYKNHVEQAERQLEREPRELPRLVLDSSADDLFAFTPAHIGFDGYDPHPAIRAKVAV